MRSVIARAPSPNWSPIALNNFPADLAVYLHWPFCVSKCPYCDFNSHEAKAIDQGRWRDALLAELAHYHAQTPNHRVTSIFFGGGTPSLMDPRTTQSLIDTIAKLWAVSADVEITLEANPSTVEAGRFSDFRSAGINRLSMGIQALNDVDLKFLGRPHTVAEALAALDIAQRNFNRYSFDLIYARPGQTVDLWEAELTQAVALAGDHLSVYQLTIEDGTPFAPRFARGEFHLPDEECAAQMFDLTQELLAHAGLPAYEISNHARAGQESRHNMTYWQGGDYIGIGPGAHGRIGALATRQHRAPDIWLERVGLHGHATQETRTLPPRERAEERVMTGLRLTEGINLAQFHQLSGLDFDAVVDPSGLAQMIEGGFLTRTPHRVAATPPGRLLLNGITRALLG